MRVAVAAVVIGGWTVAVGMDQYPASVLYERNSFGIILFVLFVAIAVVVVVVVAVAAAAAIVEFLL